MMRKTSLFVLPMVVAPGTSWAATAGGELLDLTTSGWGYLALALFAVSYVFVMAEEFTHLRKSKPVTVAAGVLWGLLA